MILRKFNFVKRIFVKVCIVINDKKIFVKILGIGEYGL